MKIGIIGAGNVGGTLGKSGRKGHNVVFESEIQTVRRCALFSIPGEAKAGLIAAAANHGKCW